jgi:hypothetical protein
MFQSPLSLPDVQDAAEPGPTIQIIWLVVALLLVAWALWYLVRKLPRGGDGLDDGRDSGEE